MASIGADEYYKGEWIENIHEGAIFNYCETFYVPHGKCICGYHKDAPYDEPEHDEEHFRKWKQEYIHRHYDCVKSNVPVIHREDGWGSEITEVYFNRDGDIEITTHNECYDDTESTLA